MSWFMKQKTNDKKTHKKQNSDSGPDCLHGNLTLPPNFADDLLNLELEVEQPNVSIEVISRLIELYGIGVEYFSSIKSDKYLVFKNKCQSLLLKPNVALVINNQYTPTPNQQENKSDNQSNETIQKQKELKNNLTYIKSLDNQEQIKKFLESEKYNQDKMSSLINDDILNQENRLNERMLRRIKDPQKQSIFLMKSQSQTQLDGRKIMSSSLKQIEKLDLDNIQLAKNLKKNIPNSDLLGIEEEDKEPTPEILQQNHFKFEAPSSKKNRKICKTETDMDQIDDEEEDQDKFNDFFKNTQETEEKQNTIEQFGYQNEQEEVKNQQEQEEVRNEQEENGQKEQQVQQDADLLGDLDFQQNQKKEEDDDSGNQSQNSSLEPQAESEKISSKQLEEKNNIGFQKKEILAYEEDLKKDIQKKSFFGKSNTLNYIFQQFTQSSKNSKETLSIHDSPEVTRKEKKIREMVNKNQFLAQQKKELLKKNQMLPF